MIRTVIIVLVVKMKGQQFFFRWILVRLSGVVTNMWSKMIRNSVENLVIILVKSENLNIFYRSPFIIQSSKSKMFSNSYVLKYPNNISV